MTYDPTTPLEKILFIKECLKQDRDILNNYLMMLLQYLDELVQYVTNTEYNYQQKLLQHGEVICRQCVPNVIVKIDNILEHNDAKHDAYKKVTC